MKASRVFFMLLALVIVVTLVACGGEKTPEVTDDAAATTTKAAATTTTAATTTKAPEITTTAAPATTTAAPKEATNTPEEYKSLYVSDGNVVHLNFAYATPDSPAIVGSANYEDENVSAVGRFNGAASNYTDYLFNSTIENPISGGTAKILTPWFFEDWYADWTSALGTGKLTDMRTIEPEEYAKITEYQGQTVYIVNTKVTETDFYIQNGMWAKKTYASQWQNGSLKLGQNSTLTYDKALKAARDGNAGYTLQFVAKKEGGNGNWSAYTGLRLNISESASDIQFASSSNGYYDGITTQRVAGDMDVINAYTLTFDNTNKASASTVDLDIYLNNAHAVDETITWKSDDATLKIFEGADSSVYSIRIYSRVLTVEEIAQNYFADLAIILQLDITEYLTLDDAAKASVHTALGEYTADIPFALVQKALDDAVAAAKQ